MESAKGKSGFRRKISCKDGVKSAALIAYVVLERILLLKNANYAAAKRLGFIERS